MMRRMRFDGKDKKLEKKYRGTICCESNVRIPTRTPFPSHTHAHPSHTFDQHGDRRAAQGLTSLLCFFFFSSSSSFSASRAQFFLRKPMHFSLIAAQDMEVIEFSRAQFLVMEKEAPQIAERIMTHVMEKVRVQYATDGAWTALHCTALHRAALRSYVTNLSRSLCSSMDLLDSLVILARHMHIMYTYVDAAKHAHLMSLLLF